MKKLNLKVERLLLKLHTNHTNTMVDEDKNHELSALKKVHYQNKYLTYNKPHYMQAHGTEDGDS